MNSPNKKKNSVMRPLWRRPSTVWVTLIVVVIAGLLMARSWKGKGVAETSPLFTVEDGSLTISVVSSGTIQSRRTSTIMSKAEGRNTVIWLIDEGRTVTNNQLLLELDASTLVDRKTDQQILVGNAESSLTAATEKLAIAKIEQRSSVAAAELKLELARLDQEKYQKGEFPQKLQEAESKIAMAKEEVERSSENLSWTRRLAEEGYLTRSELQADEMALKQREINLQAAVISLNVLTNYSSRQQEAILDSNLQQAEMDLDRVQRQMRANVVQAESALRARQMELDRQLDKLENFEQQIENCRIVAPTNGVVIYHSTMQASRRRWSRDPLEAGSTVVERQPLMHIPIDGNMIVEFSVPESSLTKIELGQKAHIKVEAVPGVEYTGKLSKIGLLPDGRNAWLNPDLQLYNCEIELDQSKELRSGMNCETEMIVEHYEKTRYVPLQSVVRVGNTPVVYVIENGQPVQRPVELGMDNNRMVRILKGLEEGEQVLLSPPLAVGAVQADSDAQKTELDNSRSQPMAREQPAAEPKAKAPSREAPPAGVDLK